MKLTLTWGRREIILSVTNRKWASLGKMQRIYEEQWAKDDARRREAEEVEKR